MAPDALDLINQRLEDILGRISRIEDHMFDDREEYSQKHIWDKLDYFVKITKSANNRITKLEHMVDKIVGAGCLLVILMPLVTAILNPTIRKLLHLE